NPSAPSADSRRWSARPCGRAGRCIPSGLLLPAVVRPFGPFLIERGAGLGGGVAEDHLYPLYPPGFIGAQDLERFPEGPHAKVSADRGVAAAIEPIEVGGHVEQPGPVFDEVLVEQPGSCPGRWDGGHEPSWCMRWE